MFTHIPASGKFVSKLIFWIGTNIKNLLLSQTERIHKNP